MDRYTPPFLGRRRGWLLTTRITPAGDRGDGLS